MLWTLLIFLSFCDTQLGVAQRGCFDHSAIVLYGECLPTIVIIIIIIIFLICSKAVNYSFLTAFYFVLQNRKWVSYFNCK